MIAILLVSSGRHTRGWGGGGRGGRKDVVGGTLYDLI